MLKGRFSTGEETYELLGQGNQQIWSKISVSVTSLGRNILFADDITPVVMNGMVVRKKRGTVV